MHYLVETSRCSLYIYIDKRGPPFTTLYLFLAVSQLPVVRSEHVRRETHLVLNLRNLNLRSSLSQLSAEELVIAGAQLVYQPVEIVQLKQAP